MRLKNKFLTIARRIYSLCLMPYALLAAVPQAAYAQTGADADIAAEAHSLNLRDNRYNPDAPWYHGWQIGLGAPIASPLPFASINGFVGYVNKDHRSFWKKRIGYRADFAFASPFELSGAASGADLILTGRVFGFKKAQTIGDLMDFDDFEDDNGDPVDINTDGINGIFAMKNQYLGGLVDFYPFGNAWFAGGLRLSGGYYFGSADIKLHATVPNYFPNDDGYAYLAMEANGGQDVFVRARMTENTRVGGSLRWNYRGPYAGIGWDIGIWRGFKFYTDMGVVFANAPKLKNSDIVIPENNFQICLVDPNNMTTKCEDNEWVGINITNPNASLNGMIVSTLLNLDSFNGIPITIPPEYANQEAMSAAVACFMNPACADNITWLTTIVSGNPQLSDIMDEIREALNDADSEFNLQGLADDYKQAREDAVDDANDFLKDLKFVPMIRLGFMYRF